MQWPVNSVTGLSKNVFQFFVRLKLSHLAMAPHLLCLERADQ